MIFPQAQQRRGGPAAATRKRTHDPAVLMIFSQAEQRLGDSNGGTLRLPGSLERRQVMHSLR
jgi:hypothetical protein